MESKWLSTGLGVDRTGVVRKEWWTMKFYVWLLQKWSVLTFSIVTIVYGLVLRLHPEIIESFKSYEIVNYWFNMRYLGSFLAILGFLNILFMVGHVRRLKRGTNVILAMAWAFLSTSLYVSAQLNTISILAGGIAFFFLGCSLRGWSDDWRMDSGGSRSYNSCCNNYRAESCQQKRHRINDDQTLNGVNGKVQRVIWGVWRTLWQVKW